MNHWQEDTQPAQALETDRGCLGRVLRLLLFVIGAALIFALGFAAGGDAEFVARANAIARTAIAPLSTLIALPTTQPTASVAPAPAASDIPPSATAIPATATITPLPTATAIRASATITPLPTSTAIPPSFTFTPSPTATFTAAPTATRIPPTATAIPAQGDCFGASQARVAGAMNIREAPDVNARIVGAAHAGEVHAVLESRRGPTWCWLRIARGWMAQTHLVSAAQPGQPAQPQQQAPASTGGGASASLAALSALAVAPENRCSPYDSDDYPYSQSVEPQIVARMGGRIYGPYTGTSFGSMSETDIEHIVAKSEAHDSGLCSADAGTRRAFSNDLLNLTLASPAVNRHQKSGYDFAEWQPALNRCWYADTIVKVKTKYRLRVDSREQAALANTLRSCNSVAMIITAARPAAPVQAPSGNQPAAPQQPAQPAPQQPSTGDWRQWDSNGNGRITCAEARAAGIAPVRRGHPAYPRMHDADKDGVVCET